MHLHIHAHMQQRTGHVPSTVLGARDTRTIKAILVLT